MGASELHEGAQAAQADPLPALHEESSGEGENPGVLAASGCLG